MSRRVVFFVSNAGYEAAWQTASTGITAAAMGDEVIFVFSFEALRALSKGTFGKPLSDRERSEATRGEGLGAPLPGKMIQDARGLGADREVERAKFVDGRTEILRGGRGLRRGQHDSGDEHLHLDSSSASCRYDASSCGDATGYSPV